VGSAVVHRRPHALQRDETSPARRDAPQHRLLTAARPQTSHARWKQQFAAPAAARSSRGRRLRRARCFAPPHALRRLLCPLLCPLPTAHAPVRQGRRHCTPHPTDSARGGTDRRAPPADSCDGRRSAGGRACGWLVARPPPTRSWCSAAPRPATATAGPPTSNTDMPANGPHRLFHARRPKNMQTRSPEALAVAGTVTAPTASSPHACCPPASQPAGSRATRWSCGAVQPQGARDALSGRRRSLGPGLWKNRRRSRLAYSPQIAAIMHAAAS
jgi:hypothetical protein